MSRYDSPSISITIPPSNIFMSRCAADAEPVKLTSAHVEDEMNSASPSSFLVPPHTASRRSVDPYETCKSQLDQFVELQDEQVELVRQLQDALRTGASALWSPALAGRRDTENVHPRAAPQTLVALPESGGDSKNTRKETGQHSGDAKAATPSVLVHRLRVWQLESAKFASTRCLPALRHLLSTFEAYWGWKRAHMKNGSEENEAAPSHFGDARMEDKDGRGKNQDAVPMPSSVPSSSLRQRYDHVLRVRDELESFLTLHTEAVQALEPHLQHWMPSDSTLKRHGISWDQGRDASFQQFLLYVQELLEVTQTVRHVAHLLQMALAALCRPSPWKAQPATSLSRHQGAAGHRANGDDGSEEERAKLQDRPVQHVNVDAPSSAGRRSGIDSKQGANSDGEGARSPFAATSPGKRRVKSLSPRTPTRQGAAAQQLPLPTTAGGANGTSTDVNYLKDDENAWVGALSPLTPPQNANAAASAAAAPSSLEVCASQRLSTCDQRDARHWQRHRRSPPAAWRARSGESSLRSPTSTAASPLCDVSASPSLSPTAAVSVSPMTAVRHVVASSPTSHTEDDGEGRCRWNSPADVSYDEGVRGPVPSPASSPSPLPSPALRQRTTFISAAVSPAPIARNADEGKYSTAKRTAKGSSEGMRSLLPELAAVQWGEAEAAVHVPLDVLRSASRSPSISIACTRAAGRDRCGSSALPERSATRGQSDGREMEEEVSAAGSVGRAASIPSSLWPQVAATAAAEEGGSMGKHAAPLETHEAEGDAPSAHKGKAIAAHPSAAAPARVDENDFYTSRSKLGGEGEGVASAPVHAKAAPSAAPPPAFLSSPPAIHVCPHFAKGAADTSVPNGSDELEVDALEKEADEIHAKLQQPSSVGFHKPGRRWVPSRSPSADLQTSSSTSTSSLSSRRLRRRRGHGSSRRRSADGERHHLERTVYRELEAIRAEQRRSLECMQHDVRAALDEVMSVATAAASSRASSRHSTDAEAAPEKSSRKSEAPSAVDTRAASPSDQLPSSAEAEALRESLAAAQARTERLEQLTIQLKKRLWLMELSANASGQQTCARSSEASSPKELDSRQRHMPLRDAFVYGSSLTSRELHEASRGSDDGAEGPLAEEQALLYLVDRALADRRERRGGALRVEGLNTELSALQTPPKACSRSSSPFTASQTTALAATADTTNVRTNKYDSPLPLKCFDGIDDVRWSQRLAQSAALPAGRSLPIWQQRASIFQRLRHNYARENTAAAASERAAVVYTPGRPVEPSQLGDVAVNHNGQGPAKEESAQLHPPPPLRPLSSLNAAPSAASEAAASLRSGAAHPYSRSSSGSPLYMSPHDLHPAPPHQHLLGSTSASQYYASISNSGNTQSPFRDPEAAGSSSLRAQQVLQNARRLLRDRNDALRRGRAATEEGCSDEASKGAYATLLKDADGEGHRPPYLVSSGPRQRNPPVHVASEDNAPLSPPPYASVMKALNSSPQPILSDATQTPFPRIHGDADEQRRRHDRERSPNRGMAVALYTGKLQSPSSEVQYFGYDTSPCSAVAYSSSKLPRTSPHHGDDTKRSVDDDPAGDETYVRNAGSASLSSPALQRAHLKDDAGRREERVHSATFPIPSPACTRDRSRSDAAAQCDEWGRGDVSVTASGEHQRLRRSQAASSQRGSPTNQRPMRGALYGVAYDARRVPSSNSSYDEDHGRTDPQQGGPLRFHRQDSERQVMWGSGAATAASRATSRNSSQPSRGSAQEELLDRLDEQEALLQQALAQLQTQQQQLREKRSQIAQLVSARSQTAVQGGTRAPHRKEAMEATRGGGAARGTRTWYAAEVRAERPTKGSLQLDKLSQLRSRLDAAERTLAAKERRMRQAMRVIQRQKAALVSDDLL
ncbi:hypothetical protein ABL78_6525 [Leptomonas seymouri]|uniref:Uncharacterized protein n=1 Tax=Leptomonas seymouri TaxID=5684 RepID=A0A0N1HV92_LEPSE|nr:hypothetical protein ABL78_6525 [Leptomonas seymouri]|eukprot:KPI84418.1 hypothetical protein ABL78_6525 [Leptomonas seymouri]